MKVLIRNGNNTLGESEALLDYRVDISLAHLNFLKRMGLRKKDLKKPMDQTIWAANQSKFKKCGRLKVKIKLENNEVEEDITIVQESLEPPLIIGWNASRLLRNDVEYPKCLKVNNVSTDIPTLDLGDDKIPSNPTAEEVEGIKEKLLEQFKDVFSDGEVSLKIMNCKPSVIELIPDAKPVRLPTARNITFGYR